MKTINLSNFGLQGVVPMSREEMKGVTGGNMPQSAGGCIECHVTSGPNEGSSSCWYSNAPTPNDLCSRVYPNEQDSGTGQGVDCHSGCVMN